MAHPLLFDCTWTQQWKYESAEAYYQQVLAGTGGAVPVSQGSQQAQGSTLKSEIAQARQNIQKALNNDSSGKSSGGAVDQQVLNRIQSLETENKNLKKNAEDLAALVKKLESRVAALETSGSGSAAPSSSAPAQSSKKEDSDSDFDPFGDDDDDDSEDEETKARVAAYNAKKAKKPVVVAKSNLILDVKPWDDETDMVETEKLVRSIEMDGLLWGAAKLVPVGYGIKKLQISAVIEDAKVSTDDLDEKITAFEDHVQSMDIVAFNKV